MVIISFSFMTFICDFGGDVVRRNQMLVTHRGERVNESGPWIFSFHSIFYVKLLLVKHLNKLWKQLYCSHVFPPTVHCCSVSVITEIIISQLM